MNQLFRATFVLGIVVFVAAVIFGLVGSFVTKQNMPGVAISYMSQVYGLIEHKEFDRANAQLRLALVLDQDNRDLVSLMLGDLLTTQGEWSEAKVHLERALRMRPEWEAAHYHYAAWLGTQGDEAGARQHYNRALRSTSDYAPAHFDLGRLNEKQRKFDEAQACYERAIQSSHDYLEAHYHLAELLLQRKEPDRAAAHYQQALGIQPDHLPSQLGLGKTMFLQGKVTEARAQLFESTRLHPDKATPHAILGAFLEEQGDVALAVQHYRLALERNGDLAEVANNLAWILATSRDDKLRNSTEALGFAKRAATLTDRKDASYLDTLATAYAAVGQFDEAVATAEEALLISRAAGDRHLAGEIYERLQLFKKSVPFSASQ